MKKRKQLTLNWVRIWNSHDIKARKKPPVDTPSHKRLIERCVNEEIRRVMREMFDDE